MAREEFETETEQQEERRYNGPLNLKHEEIAILVQLIPSDPPDNIGLPENGEEHYDNLREKVWEIKNRAGW